MQTILGSGGAIGRELAIALKQYTSDIRLVARNPEKVNPTDILVAADLTQKEAVMDAVKGSEIVYVTIGFPYSYKEWREKWPTLITHVIFACQKYNAKLVFFDNVYMYDKDHLSPMTETTQVNPPSRKGEVRAALAYMVMDQVDEGKLTALIARSADFYGPDISSTSMLTETVIKPLSEGKKANWIGPLHYKHSFTYTPDAGKALAILGNTPDAFGQIWHLPTAGKAMTGKEWVEAVAAEMDVKPKCRATPKFLFQAFGVFQPIMKELAEMFYQYDREYIFDSHKFEGHFDLKPTSYKTGIAETVNAFVKNRSKQ